MTGDLAGMKKGLDGHVWYRSRACSIIATRIRHRTRTNPDRLKKFRWPRHVQAGGRTCPVLVTGIRLGSRICSDFLESLVQENFSTIWTSPTHSMHPP
jgi:hypothetical protein